MHRLSMDTNLKHGVLTSIKFTNTPYKNAFKVTIPSNELESSSCLEKKSRILTRSEHHTLAYGFAIVFS